MISPPIDLSSYTPTTFLAMMDGFVADTSALISQPASTLLADVGSKRVHALIEKHVPGQLTAVEGIAAVLPTVAGPMGPYLAALGTALLKRTTHAYKSNGILSLTEQFSIVFPANKLEADERAALQGMARLIAQNAISIDAWARFLALLAWNDGRGALDPSPSSATHRQAVDARIILRDILEKTLPSHRATIGDAAATITLKQARVPQSSNAPSFKRGIDFLNAATIRQSPYLATTPTRSSLFLGRLPDNRQDIYFNGNESLITIAGPGAGKSQAHVIPNLLIYPGSALVLDVKGELWNTTAGFRQRHFGPVFRFSPTDVHGRSHRYNPFDQISTDPETAASDCEVFSYQIIAPNPDLKDPYWENRARDFVWAFAMLVALETPPAGRNMETLAAFTAIPTQFSSLTKPPYVGSDTQRVILRLKALADNANIPDLHHAATALESGLKDSDRLTSVMDNARRALSLFARSPALRRAMSATDWSPAHLRRHPGTTAYISLPSEHLEAYAPIIRIIFAQHRRILTSHIAQADEPPITFFLDEMPQLGRFDDILRMQDLGRSAGLRLWMFAQQTAQIQQAYGNDRADGLIGANRIQCYMEPDMAAASALASAFGKTTNDLTGEERDLASAAELASSPKFTDKIITVVRGHLPVILTKHMAYLKLKDRMLPPPEVPHAKP